MTRRTWPATAGAVAVMALLGGCGLGFGDEMIGASSATVGSTGVVVPMTPSSTDQGQAAGASSPSGSSSQAAGTSTSTAPSSGNDVAAVTQIRDGVWAVGDGGQVEFLVKNGQLALMSSTPASGWQQKEPVQEPNKIEVTFTQTLGTTWTFRAQLSGGTLQITKTQSIPQASDGSYPVGGAGSVGFTSVNSRLSLTSVAPEGGWTVTKRQATPASIAVSFKKGAGTADFTATLSGQQVAVTASQQLSGQAPAK